VAAARTVYRARLATEDREHPTTQQSDGNLIQSALRRGVAQSGSASALGAEGRGFESLRPDHRFNYLARSHACIGKSL
jgi:hypothetical protein